MIQGTQTLGQYKAEVSPMSRACIVNARRQESPKNQEEKTAGKIRMWWKDNNIAVGTTKMIHARV